jgi:hypothetical protein
MKRLFLVLLLCGCSKSSPSSNTVLAQGPTPISGDFALNLYRQIGNGGSGSIFSNSVGTIGISGGIVTGGDLNITWMTSTGLVRCQVAGLSGTITPGANTSVPATLILNITQAGDCLADTLTLDVVEANTGHVAVFSGGNPSATPFSGTTAAEIANGSMETQ